MKKKPLTLLEIIIVIFLITLITGAVGYSMKGTLDKGRIFRTEQAIEQLRDLFLICLAEGESSEDILRDPAGVIKKCGLAKNPSKLVEDGWGKKLDISFSKGDFKITSSNLALHKKKTKMAHEEISEEE
jgi:hypothetical protein